MEVEQLADVRVHRSPGLPVAERRSRVEAGGGATGAMRTPRPSSGDLQDDTTPGAAGQPLARSLLVELAAREHASLGDADDPSRDRHA